MKKNKIFIISLIGVTLSVITGSCKKSSKSETARIGESAGLELSVRSLSSNIESGNTYKANVELRNSGKNPIFIVDPNRLTGPPIIKLNGVLPYGRSEVEVIPINDYFLVELAPMQTLSWEMDLSVNKDGRLECHSSYQVFDLDEYHKDVCFELGVKWVDFASNSSGEEVLLTKAVRVSFLNIVVDPKRARDAKERLEEKPDLKGLPKI